MLQSIKKTKLLILTAILLLLSFNGCSKEAKETTHKAPDTPGWQKVTIQRVVDGDTVVVKDKKNEYKVRMIGINTPESVSKDESKNCEEGKIASDYTKELLPKGTEVYIEYDQDKTDDYDRTLAYLWFDKEINASYETFKEKNVGAMIMQNTYCESMYIEPNDKYKAWYQALENEKTQMKFPEK